MELASNLRQRAEQRLSCLGDRPVVTRVYQHHSLDSTRWNGFTPRSGDIVIASAYKAGTTWIQQIVLSLLNPGDASHALPERSPWLEAPIIPLANVLAGLDAQTSRRVIKTHLPADGLPYHRDIQYILVCRDARDVFMSLWNHYRMAIRYPFFSLSMHPRRVGGPLPRCPDDVRQFWRDWITRGWFPWEREGYPFWANLRHTQTWWEWRHLPNVLYVHFNDLLADLRGQVAAIAGYLDIALDAPTLDAVADTARFESMHARADALIPTARSMFIGGAESFIYKGTNGRWKGVLTSEDLELYEGAAARELSPECRRWIERGSR